MNVGKYGLAALIRIIASSPLVYFKKSTSALLLDSEFVNGPVGLSPDVSMGSHLTKKKKKGQMKKLKKFSETVLAEVQLNLSPSSVT